MLGALVDNVGATAAFLVEKSGQMLASEGDMKGLDTASIASLVSSAFASSRAVAKLIGEPEFTAMFQQGDRSSIFLYALTTQDILVVIFTDVAKTGLVKVSAEQTAKALTAELNLMSPPGT